MSSLMERVAGAPISWGVCEVPGWGFQLDPDRVLREMRGLGLHATELGPEGFLPTDPGQLRSLLGAEGLDLVGGFLPLVLHREDGIEEGMRHASAYADLLAAAGARVLVLAAAATDGSAYEASAELDDASWSRLLRGIDRVAKIGAERGLVVALHPHVGTVIERPREVERLLDTSAATLCVDTGHLLVGGADPLGVLRAAAGRVGHVHLKDVAGEWAERVRSGRSGYRDAVRGGMYRPLGQGDLDVRSILRALRDAGYAGWLVLEQDTVLDGLPDEEGGPALAAAASLDFLRRAAAELDQDPGQGGRDRRAAQGATSRAREEGS